AGGEGQALEDAERARLHLLLELHVEGIGQQARTGEEAGQELAAERPAERVHRMVPAMGAELSDMQSPPGAETKSPALAGLFEACGSGPYSTGRSTSST